MDTPTPKRNLTNPILVVLLVVAAFAIGMLWQQNKTLKTTTTGTTGTTPAAGTQQGAPKAAEVSLDQIKGLFSKDLMKFGDANRKALFVAVEDPSCPYCSIASGHNSELNKSAGAQFLLVADGGSYVPPIIEMKKLLDQNKASFVYLYTPGHGNGEMGTKALYCAYEKNKFWPVHDLLMTSAGYDLLNNTVKNDKTKSQVIADFLKSAINPAELKACIDSGKYDARLSSDTQLATTLGVQGTPGFFVNATRFDGAYSYTQMESAVSTALK